MLLRASRTSDQREREFQVIGFNLLIFIPTKVSCCQAKIADLKSETKRLECEKLMEQKDKETALALLQSNVDNLLKKLKEREVAFSALQESSRAEQLDAKSKMKAMKEEFDCKLSKEQEEFSKKYENQKLKFEAVVRDLREEIHSSQTVKRNTAYLPDSLIYYGTHASITLCFYTRI